MITEEQTDVLDNPIWSALTSRRAGFSQGGELARRFLPEIGPLAGIREQSDEAYAELGGMLGAGEIAVLFLESEPQLPAGLKLLVHKPGDQMVFRGSKFPQGLSGSLKGEFEIERLGESDIEEMVALTALTDPGPFRTRTIDLGGFLGIRVDGRLAAMAGQRLSMPGFTEVSAVCTHPDFRGRGYAQALVMAVVREIEARGDTPMLHVFSGNRSAIRVYEALGFVLRRQLHIAVVTPEALEG